MSEVKTFEELTFIPMTKEDIPELTAIMKASFDDDSKRHFDRPVGGPPGYDDGSFLTKWGLESGAESYSINRDSKKIGALILFINSEEHKGFLGTVFLDPTLIDHGIGTKVWKFVEASHPDIKEWRTETPAVSYRNHRFYINRCGFHVVAVDGDQNKYSAQFQLMKVID